MGQLVAEAPGGHIRSLHLKKFALPVLGPDLHPRGTGDLPPETGHRQTAFKALLRRAVLVVTEEGEMIELVNPEIIAQEGEQEGFEGCLSVPGSGPGPSPTRDG